MNIRSGTAFLTILLTVMIALLPAQPQAQVPAPMPLAAVDSAFYLQINIERMRNGAASAELYAWLEREALNELRAELANQMIDQLEGISIFGSGSEQNPAIVMHGNTSQSMRDNIVDRLFADDRELELLSRHGRNYYAFDEVDIRLEGITINEIDSDTLYLAFGDNNQTLITPAEDVLDSFLQQGSFQMQALPQELIVIQANRALVQGGMNPRHEVFGENDAWQSSLFRSVEKFALVVADAEDAINISLEAHSADDNAASALANIVQGILSLKALADAENEDEDLAWISQLKVSTDNHITRFDLGLPVQQLLQIID
ncbi:MAG: hypothetical protein Tsb0027_16810 [Wenzhouxiangellaceae bacterium]